MNRKDPISLETIKLLPGIFLPDYLEGTDVGPIIEALYSQLENRNREQVKVKSAEFEIGNKINIWILSTQRWSIY